MSVSKLKRAIWGAVRAALVIGSLFVATLALGLSTAKAAFGERLLGFGAELSHWENFHLSTAPRRISLNGAELELVVATTQLSIADTLDRLEGVCEQGGGVVGSNVLPKLLKATTAVSRSWLSGRIRKESERDGVLACLDSGMPLGLEELNARLHAFAKSADLKELGALRYATARRTGNVTTVLFIWSEGSVPLRAMFPKSGDAPGFDPHGVPRPKGSSRLLSGAEHGAPYSIAVYRTEMETPEALLGWYRTALPAAGFVVEDAASSALLARQDERTLLIHATKTAHGVAVAVAELK